MSRLLWGGFSLVVFLLVFFAGRFWLQAAVTGYQEKAWSCGYAQARCEWTTGPDHAVYCDEVKRTCGGLEWIAEGRAQ